jgi:hypothetical protein
MMRGMVLGYSGSTSRTPLGSKSACLITFGLCMSSSMLSYERGEHVVTAVMLGVSEEGSRQETKSKRSYIGWP